MMRNYWAVFAEDADKDDIVSMQNERLAAVREREEHYRHARATGIVRPSPEKRRKRAPVGAHDCLSHEHGDRLVMPMPGDELILVLEKVPVHSTLYDGGEGGDDADRWAYMLPNFLEGGSGDTSSVKMVFPPLKPRQGRPFDDREPRHVWQLVPSIASASNISCWERRGFWRLGVVHGPRGI